MLCLTINGQKKELSLSHATLPNLLHDLGLVPSDVVVELNGNIYKGIDPNITIPNDATIEILHFVGGG